MTTSAISYAEAEDVLRFLLGQSDAALVIVTKTEGGALRAPGAMMAVTADGRHAGYVSNGCIDADVVARAQAVLISGEAVTLRYGQGSPFIDLRLPCGGAIEVLIVPSPDRAALADALAQLAARRAAQVTLSAGCSVTLQPRLRLRIAGVGAEALALARLARAAEMAVLVQSPDAKTLGVAQAEGLSTEQLNTTSVAQCSDDDARTAVVLLFHDHDWEPDLLIAALAGPACYIGALGSRRTHAARLDRLRARGVDDADLARIKGPAGLVPALRDAPLIAASILAEVIAAARQGAAE